jgi:hypothetical protein
MYYKKKTLFEIDLSDWDMDERDVFFQDLAGGYVDSRGVFDRIKICVSFSGRNYPFKASSFSIDMETNGTTFNDPFFFDDDMEYPKTHSIKTNDIFFGYSLNSLKEVFLKITSLGRSRINGFINDFSLDNLISFVVMKGALNLMFLDELRMGFIIDNTLDYVFGESSRYLEIFEREQFTSEKYDMSRFKIINASDVFSAKILETMNRCRRVYDLLVEYSNINNNNIIDASQATAFIPLQPETDYLNWFFKIAETEDLKDMPLKPNLLIRGKSNYFKYSIEKLSKDDLELEF